MAEFVATAEEIIKIGISVHEVIQDVKTFKSYADNLIGQIDHLIPSVEVLAGINTQDGELSAALEQEPQLLNIATSLSDMLELMKEVKVFAEDLKGVNFFRKITERRRIKRKYDQLSQKLEVLRGSTSFEILAEALKDIQSERFLEPAVKTLVRHARNFGSVTSGNYNNDTTPNTKRHSRSKYLELRNILVTGHMHGHMIKLFLRVDIMIW